MCFVHTENIKNFGLAFSYVYLIAIYNYTEFSVARLSWSALLDRRKDFLTSKSMAGILVHIKHTNLVLGHIDFSLAYLNVHRAPPLLQPLLYTGLKFVHAFKNSSEGAKNTARNGS